MAERDEKRTKQFQSKDDAPTSSASSPSTLHTPTTRSVNNDPPQPAPPSRWLTWLTMPFGFVWRIAWSLLSFASQILPRASITQPPASSTSPEDRKKAAAARFLHSFEEKYGTTHVDFFQRGYSEALEAARRELRFLLVILLSEEHDDTDAYCRDTLTSPDLIAFLQEKNMLVWAGNVSESEASSVGTKLNATRYPFMAVITLRTHVGNPPKMTVVDRFEGKKSPHELTDCLKQRLNVDARTLNRLQLERKQKESERRLREEQDQAYEESLRQDQEKARKEKEARVEKERQRAKEQEEQAKAQQHAEKRKAYIRYLSRHLPTEPSPADKNVIRVKFQLVEGEAPQRAFSGDTPVEDLYKFIEVYRARRAGDCNDESATGEDISCPEDYRHNYTFEIHARVPRISYPPTPDKALRDHGLAGGVVLIVDDIDPEDD